ncbi:MAG: hypothetical protein M3R13_06430 [Armatimonadota bacterium]|nr:hypothetical protein [Armatimonadota bacterium]
MINAPFGPFWMALLISALLGWPMLLVLRRLRAHASISQYTPEHAGKAGTPSMGGIAPLLAMIVTVWLVSITSNAYLETVEVGPDFHWPIEQFRAILIGLFGFGLLGFVDDFLIPRFLSGKRGLGWTQKLLAQLAVVSLMVGALGLGSIQLSLTVGFIILFFANAVNFSDGLDGLCGGLLILSTVFYMTGIVGFAAMAMVGALVPFMFLNAPPAKIFMGDVGALPFGATYGVMFATALIDQSEIHSLTYVICVLVTISLIFILELALVPIQLFWVKVFKRRLIPASPVHHSFEKLGWPETRITAIFLLIQFILTMIAMSSALGTWRML